MVAMRASWLLVLLLAASCGSGSGGSGGGPGAPAGADLDADGRDDLLVADWLDDTAGVDAGAVRVYLRRGVAEGTVLAAVLTGRAAGDWFGFAAAPVGDFDGDGYGDVVVGAHRHFAGDQDAGEAYLFRGGEVAAGGAGDGYGFDPEPDGTYTGPPCQELGYSVAAAGDLDGDGFADVAIGGRGYGAGAAGNGRVFVMLGGPGAGVAYDFEADAVLQSGVLGDHFGAAVAAAGDRDGDGRDDLVVCAPVVPPWGLPAGVWDGVDASGGLAYLFLGGLGGPDGEADEVLAAAEAAERFAGACAGLAPSGNTK